MSDTRPKRKVLLIGWDAADWEMISPLLDNGVMPTLSTLVDRGVMGNIATLQPCLSPILWTSIATGKLADKHGILGFIEPDEQGSVRLSTSTTRRTKALWNILSQNGLRTNVVSWYASHPAEPINGACVSNLFDQNPTPDPSAWPLGEHTVHPARLRERVAELRLHPHEIGAPDLAHFIPNLAEIDLKTDHRPFELATAIAHCGSVQAIATELMAHEPWDFMAVYYDTLDTAGHVFMPYHPPRMDHISERDFALYQHVMVRLYQFHDTMLRRLLELAGDDTTVILVSDHGFYNDQRRPKTAIAGDSQEALAAAWHRQFGVICMAGPGIKRDERIHGATLLDIAPTVLNLFGIPAGADMDGHLISLAFDDPPQIQSIPSWDRVEGDAGMHPVGSRGAAGSSQATIDRLVALGYLDASAATPNAQVAAATSEADLNLATVYLNSFRPAKALPILERLHAAQPENHRIAMVRAWALVDCRKPREACAALEALAARGVRSPDADAMHAGQQHALGDTAAGIARLERAVAEWPTSMTVLLMLGKLHADRKSWGDAERVFAQAAALDQHSAQAQYGLSQARVELGQFEAAAECALQALSVAHMFPAAHYCLGRALLGLGMVDHAIKSMETAVSISPGYAPAHRQLAELYRSRGDGVKALEHDRMADGHMPQPAETPFG